MSRMTSAPEPSGRLTHSLDEVLLAVVDEDFGAQLFTEFELRRRTGGDRDTAVKRPGHLNGVRSDAAGTAVKQHHLACRQARGHHKVGPHRAGHLGKGRRVMKPDGVRDGHDLTRGHRHILGVTAARQQSAHGLPDRPLIHPFADLGDGP